MTGQGRAERVHELLYSCDSRSELCERICALEELIVDIWTTCPIDVRSCLSCRFYVNGDDGGATCALYGRISELGIEVNG